MIGRFGNKYIVHLGGADLRNKRVLRKETISRKHEPSVWVILAYFGEQPFGGVDFTILFRATISVAHLFRHQRNHLTEIRMHETGLDDLMRVCRGPISMGRGQTVLTMELLRAKVLRPINRTEVKARK